ncbi:MAG TPA: hypothetical protein EYP19_02675 [Desulfobacterales bacterium]|nr:hypothetical protein [Desulfobacterales bacterium]
MKSTVLCLILLLSFAPVALAGMEYDPIKDRWEFVPDRDEETKYRTPEDEWSYRKPEQKPAEEPKELPPQNPEQSPPKRPEEMPPKKPMGPPLHMLPRTK